MFLCLSLYPFSHKRNVIVYKAGTKRGKTTGRGKGGKHKGIISKVKHKHTTQ